MSALRLFVGIPVPPSDLFGQIADELAATVGARPVPGGSWHVTLRFLGHVHDPRPVADALRATVAGRTAMPATVRGLGAFPYAARARVAWAGVDAPGLDEVAAAVRHAFPETGDRPFRAHATIARLDPPADLRPLVARHAQVPFSHGLLDRVVLYRSDLQPGGPRYAPLETVHLDSHA